MNVSAIVGATEGHAKRRVDLVVLDARSWETVASDAHEFDVLRPPGVEQILPRHDEIGTVKLGNGAARTTCLVTFS